jgi:hypothetical protein
MTSIPMIKYFTSTDVQIYLGDVLLDEAFSIEYAMSAPKYPVQGYHSRRVQAWADGVEICQGNLEMNFKYRNELSMALNPSMLQTKPTIMSRDNLAAITGILTTLGQAVQWSYYLDNGTLKPVGNVSQINQGGVYSPWSPRPENVNTKTSAETSLYALGVSQASVLDFEVSVAGTIISSGANAYLDCPATVPSQVDIYAPMFNRSSQANFGTSIAMANPDAMKDVFWRAQASSKLPVPFDASFTSLKNDLEIWMLLSMEMIGNDLVMKPREKIIIKDIHFTGESIPMGMQQRDYIRVMYPFVASHVE